MLASAAGIPESILYAGFRNKERLFREAVENNIDTRLRLLEARTLSATYESETMAVQRIAEATVRVCVVEAVTSILTSWALLEDHDYAANLYRNEIGSVEFVWNRALAERSPVGASQPGYDRPRHGRVPDEDGIEGMPGLSLLDVRKDD
jgi:AcrR family transcriptional regulator